MTYLNQMYGRNKPDQTQSSSDKNPNRVSGGLKAQGVDKIIMMAEDGSEQTVATHKYVQSLEEQVKKQRAAIQTLERKITRLSTDVGNLAIHNHNRRDR